MKELKFSPSATKSEGPLLETVQIMILDADGLRVAIDVPRIGWESIVKIAESSGEDPQDHLFRLFMHSYRRYRRSSYISETMTKKRSRLST